MFTRNKLQNLEKFARLLTNDPSLKLQQLADQSYLKAGYGILTVDLIPIPGGFRIHNIAYVPQADIPLAFRDRDLRFVKFLQEIVVEYQPMQGYALAAITGGAEYASIIA